MEAKRRKRILEGEHLDLDCFCIITNEQLEGYEKKRGKMKAEVRERKKEEEDV